VKLTKGLRRIVNFLEEHPNEYFTQKEISEQLNKSAGTISSQIKKLVNLNLINYQAPAGRTPARISFRRSGPNGKTQTQSQIQSQTQTQSQTETQSQRIKLDTPEAFQEAFEKYNNNYTETKDFETQRLINKVKSLNYHLDKACEQRDRYLNENKILEQEKQALLDTIENLKIQIENLDESRLQEISFNSFYAKLLNSNSPSAINLKQRLNLKKSGKYYRANRNRYFAIIHEIIDVLGE